MGVRVPDDGETLPMMVAVPDAGVPSVPLSALLRPSKEPAVSTAAGISMEELKDLQGDILGVDELSDDTTHGADDL